LHLKVIEVRAPVAPRSFSAPRRFFLLLTSGSMQYYIYEGCQEMLPIPGRRRNHLKSLTKSLIAVLIFLFLGGARVLRSQDQSLDSKDTEILQKYKTVNREFLKGRELVVKQKYDQAQPILLKVLDRMPEHPEASYLLAQIYYKEGDFEKGLASIQNAETHFSSVQRILFKQQLKLGDQYSSNKQELTQEIQVLESQLSQAKSEEERRDLQRQIIEKQVQSSTMEMHNKEQSLYESTGMPADYSYFHGNLLFKMKRYQEALDQYQIGRASCRERV
jgi:tetratricopeptide (TPR) repeat protein